MPARPLEIPRGILFDRNNCWVKITGSTALIGLTEYGQKIIGDILYLELFSAGTMVKKGEKVGSIESSKWVGTILTPLTGKVLRANDEVEANPRLVNMDPYEKGWLFLMEIHNAGELDDLMNSQVYEKWVKEQIGRRHEDEII